MVQRNTEPNADVKLTSATNKQDFPSRTADKDPGQDDNKRRIQAAKEADLERQTFESQRDPGDPVRLTSEEGTVVTASGSLVERMKASGFS